MARNQSRSSVTGKHRVARRTKIALGAIGLAIAVGALAVSVTTGRTGEASADPADPSFFIDINKVPSGNNVSKLAQQGAQGSFTVDCGTNADGSHANPDNFIAQPGIKNGAQHLHDYVGNLTTNSDSSIQSLLKGGTTCQNGDKSAYFWPVIRIDKEDKAAGNAKNQQAQQKQKGKVNDVQGQDEAANAADQAAAADQNAQDQNAQDQNAQDQNQQDQNQQQGNQNQQQNKKKNTGGGQAGGGNQNAQGQDQNAQNQQNKRFGQFQNGLQQFKNRQQQNQNNQNQNQQGKNQNQQQAAKDKAAKDKAAADKAAQQDLGGVQGPNNEVGDNDGEIIEPESATLKFISGGADKVVQMPFGLKILYGDAKQSTNGPANARPSWTCTGFEDRLTDLYPICPQGSKVERIHAFPNCWDGKNTDSANHRTHIVFADQNSNKCPKGFVKVPQLQVTLVYDVPQDVQVNGQYKVDAFAQEKHNPRSDHDDFANVMSNAIMKRLTNCINTGKACAE